MTSSTGSAVSLPFIRELASEPDPGTKPTISCRDGHQVAIYRSSRLDFRRQVIEELPQDGIILIRIAPTASSPFSVAMTRSEFETQFAGILQTESWKIGGRYHFPTFPQRARPFLVDSGLVPAVSSVARPKEWRQKEHGALANVLQESSQCLAQVAAWRDAWRPKQVRILLIAESHVGEMEGDNEVRVKVPFPAAESLPERYCRLVYCLGYGENEICEPRPQGNRGTPQYWEIFSRIAGLEPQLKSRFFLSDRLAQKVRILRALRERGIWLVDASTRALYHPGKSGKSPSYAQIVRESWEQTVWLSVSAEPIKLTCVIGRGVALALGSLPELRDALLISQPQDRNAARYREGLSRLLERIRSVGAEPSRSV